MITILHLSDIHFGGTNPYYSNAQLLAQLISLAKGFVPDELFLVISGDVTLKGQKAGYENAKMFFRRMIIEGGISEKHILLCPGNHDIVEEAFQSFDAFSFGIRSDNHFTYSEQTHAILETDEIFFLVLNSAYKLDYGYGIVDVDGAKQTLKAAVNNAPKLRIAILHHHLINQYELDVSALRNAYNLLEVLDQYEFRLIIHGHQHCNQMLPIGNSKMRIFGVRSLGFDTAGFQNGFNIYQIERRKISASPYSFTKDLIGTSGAGGFVKTGTFVFKR